MASFAQRLAREQRAFLSRPRGAWASHLDQAQRFLGHLLASSDPDRPVLILGAGTGLEVPWSEAPRGTVGWDADPWDEAPELEAAFQAWHRRLLTAFLDALAQSGASLGLLHDRAVLEGPEIPALGPFADTWMQQLQGAGSVEAHDPLSGLDVLAVLVPRRPVLAQRWWWPVGPGQIHLVEALAYEA